MSMLCPWLTLELPNTFLQSKVTNQIGNNIFCMPNCMLGMALNKSLVNILYTFVIIVPYKQCQNRPIKTIKLN